MDIIEKKKNSPEIFRLKKKAAGKQKNRKTSVEIEQQFKQKKMVSETTGQNDRDSSRLQCNWNYCSEIKKRRGGGHFELAEPKACSSTEECEVSKSSSNSPIVDLKDYDIIEKTIQYIQVNHVIEKPKMK